MRMAPLLGCLAIVVCGLWAFAPTFVGPYLADDYFLLGNLVDDQGEPRWAEALARYVTPVADIDQALFYRPVYQLSYFIDVLVFGADPTASRWLNAAIHLAAALVLFSLFARMLHNRAAAWVGAALFAIFPYSTEPALWVGSRGDSLAVLFGATALHLFLGGLRAGFGVGRYLATGGAVLASLCSKEPALVLVPSMLVFHWFFADERTRALPLLARARAVLRGSWWLLAVLGSYFAFRKYTLGVFLGGYPHMRETPLLHSEFLEQKASLLGLLGFPIRTSWTASVDPALLGAMIAVILAGILIATFRSASPAARTLRWSVVWLLASLVLVHDTTVDADDLESDRFLYHAAMAWCFVVTAAGTMLARGSSRRPLAVVGSAALLVLAWVHLADRVAGYVSAHRTAEKVFAQTRELYLAEDSAPLLVHGLPHSENGVLLAINAYPFALEPPFVPPGSERTMHGITDALVHNGYGGYAVVFSILNPATVFAGWDPDAETLVLGERPAFPVRLRGRIEHGEGGWVLQPAAIALDDAFELLADWSGRFAEIEGPYRSGHPVRVKKVSAATPGLSVAERDGVPVIVVEATPGAEAFVVSGDERMLVTIGQVGSALLKDPKSRVLGRMPPSGRVEIPLEELVAPGGGRPRYCQLAVQEGRGRMLYRDLIELPW